MAGEHEAFLLLVGYLQQDICVAKLIEGTPAGEIFSAQHADIKRNRFT
jgi:hypothetical protein